MDPQNQPVTTNPTPTAASAPPDNTAKKSLLVVILLVIIVAGGGFGYMVLKNELKTKDASMPPGESTPAVERSVLVSPTVAIPTATPTPVLKTATDVDNEIKGIDTSVDSTSSNDFDPNSLSDL